MIALGQQVAPQGHLSSITLPAQLETQRLVLREAQETDIDCILQGLSDFDVARMVEGASLPFLRQDALELFHALPFSGNGGFTYALAKKGGDVIGVICLQGANGRYRLQYWLTRSEWSQGFMGEALNALLSAFFSSNTDGVISADVFADDVPALKLQQRLGFAPQGCKEAYARIRSAMVLKIQMQLTCDNFRKGGNIQQ